ncbi:MAG: c-type cytochrome [Candidatus Rokuibacteriota bacterium]
MSLGRRLGLALLLGLAATSAPSAVDAASHRVALGKELYVERCALCHGSQGHGWEWTQKVMKPPVPVPNFVETVPKMSDDDLKRIILDGGEAVGKTRFMPAFGFNMKDGDVEAVIAYLRSITGRATAR